MQRESLEMPDRQHQHTLCSTSSNPGAAPVPFVQMPSFALTPHVSQTTTREVPSCLLYVLIEQLKPNKTKSEIQMLVSKLIGNRMQL